MSETATLPPAGGYDAEMRFGVVMYGGVSLAIYIYGVSRELFELACATPLEGRTLDLADAEGTREIYRRLARLASDPGLRQAYAAALARRPAASVEDVWDGAWDEGARTRFVIDVIAGTSAGGINGVYLAKALTLAQPFSVLRDLWVGEGDLGKLLNDGQAADGVPGGLPAQPGGPQSLLSSDRMYRKLAKALDDMQAQGAAASGGADADSPLVEVLDLYVTTTDIVGAPVELRLFDKVVYERRHKQRFHFSYPSQVGGAAAPAGDFSAANHAFLAYAARCTSSFPFAFEPMQLGHVLALEPALAAGRLDDWRAYFDGYTPAALARADWAERAFGDGGYLDNKPFSYVVEALSQRFGDAPAQRKLIYVEPDPERLDPVRDAAAATPNALANAIDALTVIPQYETIREDLLAVLQRNRRIERVERLLRLSEADVERRGEGYARVRCIDGEVPKWSRLSLQAMVSYYGSGFLPYRLLRVYAVSDWLAEQLAAAFGIDSESDRGYALRAVVRAWRQQHFIDNPPDSSAALGADRAYAEGAQRSVNAFLDEHDLDYRLRRLAFLLRRIDQLTRLLRDQAQGATGAPGYQRSELEQLIVAKVGRIFGAADPFQQPVLAPALLARLVDLKAQLRRHYAALLALRKRWARGTVVAAAVPIDDRLRAELAAVLGLLIGEPDAAARATVQSLRTVAGHSVPLPDARPWLQAASAAHGLQDSVMARVEAWLAEARERAQSPLLLWDRLQVALRATRLDLERPPAPGEPDLKALLQASWDLLGRPQLQAVALAQPREVEGERRTHEAQLVVEPVRSDLAGRDIAGSAEAVAATALRRLLGEYYLSFDAFDQTRFTLYYDTATGEPAVVDVVRVSPVDALSLRPDAGAGSKLAGTALAHFGAFLDEHWRRNDIMWGRLDGIERLLQAVLPTEDEATRAVRAELVRLAQGRVLTHTLKTAAAGALTQQLVGVLREREPDGPIAARMQRLLVELKVVESPAREGLVRALQALLEPDALRDFVKTQPTFDPQPPMAATLATAARAVTITGRILDGISRSDAAAARPLARWLSRLGLVLQGAVAVAIPGSLARRLWNHWLTLLYVFEALLLVVAFFFGGASLRASAVGALLATAGAHLATLLLRDVMRGRGPWLRGLALAGAALLAAATGVAVLALYWWGGAALCGPPGSVLPAALALLGPPCQWLR